MREFIDAILTSIGAASMNDEEFELITITEATLTKELYTEILLVLDSREAVSSDRDRLAYYFKARGIDIATVAPARKSEILIGIPLCM